MRALVIAAATVAAAVAAPAQAALPIVGTGTLYDGQEQPDYIAVNQSTPGRYKVSWELARPLRTDEYGPEYAVLYINGSWSSEWFWADGGYHAELIEYFDVYEIFTRKGSRFFTVNEPKVEYGDEYVRYLNWYFDGVTMFGGYLQSPVDFTVTITSAPIPEPASWAMLIVGFGVVGMAMRRGRVVGLPESA